MLKGDRRLKWGQINTKSIATMYILVNVHTYVHIYTHNEYECIEK